jgi:hypothetical protein
MEREQSLDVDYAELSMDKLRKLIEAKERRKLVGAALNRARYGG